MMGKRKKITGGLEVSETRMLEGILGVAETDEKKESVAINEIQLLLAEKRTSLAALRTGIAVFVLPLSVLSFLVATSKLYSGQDVGHYLYPLLVICAGLVILGGYLVFRSMFRLRNFDRRISKIIRQNQHLTEILD